MARYAASGTRTSLGQLLQDFGLLFEKVVDVVFV